MPIVGAAVIAGIALIVVIVVGSGKDTRIGLKTDADGALACPPTYDHHAIVEGKAVPRAWVPLQPTGVDGTEYLVPNTKPQHVTICRYPGDSVPISKAAEVPVNGKQIVKTNTSAMTRTLSEAPRTKVIASGDCVGTQPTYLVGFVFDTGAAWVAVPGTLCQHITNGEYDSTVQVRDQVVAAFDSGTWK
jgi:hypothetical protein